MTQHILVAGGGIAGLAFAALAARRGRRVTVLERAAAFNEGGYAIGLWRNGYAALRKMGLAEQAAARGFAVARQILADEKGEVLKQTDLSALSAQSGGAVRFMPRGALHRVLQGALNDNVNIRFNAGLASLDENKESVTARDTLGNVEDYDLVIGADGAHSATRRLLFSRGEDGEKFYDAVFYWGDASCADWSPPLENDVEMMGAGAFLGVYPFSAARCGFYAALYPGADSLRRAPLNVLRGALANFGGHAPKLLAGLREDSPVFGGQMAEVDAPRWSRGRCLLIGDAAHALLPTSGQGINFALEDAALLDEMLAAQKPLAETFAAFEKRRRARIAPVRRRARMLHTMNALATRNRPLFCRLRRALARRSSGANKEKRLQKFFKGSLS